MKDTGKKEQEQFPTIGDERVGKFVRYYALSQRGARRTSDETEEMLSIHDELTDAYKEVLETTCRAELEDIEQTFEEYDHWREGGRILFFQALDEVLRGTLVPTLEAVNTVEIDRVLRELYAAHVTVAGRLEELEPALDRWLKHERKINDVVKAVCGLDKEWQADALVRLVVPGKVYNKIRALETYTAQFKNRQAALDKAYEIVSRLVTLHIDTPAGEFAFKTRDADMAQQQLGEVGATVARRAATQSTDISSRVAKPGMFGSGRGRPSGPA